MFPIRKHFHWVFVSYVEHVLRELVAEWLKWRPPAMVERELLVEPVEGLAAAVVRPRRAGKTYLLYQTAVRIGRARAIIINFEDVRLASLSPRHFGAFIKVLAEAGNPPVLLLDEVQNIPH